MDLTLKILLALDALLLIALLIFVIVRAINKFYKTKEQVLEPYASQEAEALRKDATSLFIGDLDDLSSKKNKA